MKRLQRSDISDQRLEWLAKERLDVKNGQLYTAADIGFLVYLIQELEHKVHGLEERELENSDERDT